MILYMAKRKCAACNGTVGTPGATEEDAKQRLEESEFVCEVRQRVFGKPLKHVLIGPVVIEKIGS